jgi:hypothetical protein
LRSITALMVCWGVLACGPTKVYSVWLAPSGAQYDSLRSLVCGLAARYPSHCFIPHVTVVADVPGTLDDIAHRANDLARRMGALEARLTSIEWTHDYYRSFIVLIDETAGFAKLYGDTCAVIGKCQTRPYHMSIMYADKLGDSARAAIRDSLYTGRGARTLGRTVKLTRLLVCFTSGLPPEEWTCPREIKLE